MSTAEMERLEREVLGYALSVARAREDGAALMEQTVVMAAEKHEVPQVGPPAARPMVDVVGIDEALLAATREPASVIATVQGAPQ